MELEQELLVAVYLLDGELDAYEEEDQTYDAPQSPTEAQGEPFNGF